MSLDTKYRPHRYEDVLGQEATIRVLRQYVASGSGFHQSYVFAGSFGSGKTTLGRILARTLLCETPVEGDPCDSCGSCLSILEEGSSEDFVEVDAATNSGKADIKQIASSVDYHTFSGKRRIYLFDESHRLTPDALDALLKPMEENVPSSQDKRLVCIFCTTEPEKMRRTILSRCAPVFSIQTVTPAQIAERLDHICEAEGLEREADALALIAEVSECHIRDAIKAVEGVSRVGVISREAVLGYLNLDKNTTFLDLLLNLENTGLALQHAQDLLKVITPVTVYERLISICMLAWMSGEGLKRVPSYWDRGKIQGVADKYGDRLLLVTQRLSKRPSHPSGSMLLCDLAYLSRALVGSVPLVESRAPLAVSHVPMPSGLPGPSSRMDGSSKVERTPLSSDPVQQSDPVGNVDQRQPVARTTSDGVHLPPGARRQDNGLAAKLAKRIPGELTEEEFILFLTRALEERGLLNGHQG